MSWVDCDPFMLFPNAVEDATLVKLTAPGRDNETIADGLKVIVKRATQSDEPTDYGSRTLSRSIHIQPATIPEPYRSNPELLLDFIITLSTGRTYQITDASRGDDMADGVLRFIHVEARPYGRSSI